MYAVLRQASCFVSVCTGNNQRTFRRGPVALSPFPSRTSAQSFYNTYGSEHAARFYNRPREVKELVIRLKDEPTFTVLLGPPSSGKTALARAVTSLRRADQTPEFHPLTIDLRAADTMKNGSFLNAFLLQGQRHAIEGGWWNKWLSGLEVSAGGVSAKFGNKTVFPASAGNIFDDLATQLKPWDLVHGGRPPIIVVDEANFFKRIEDDAFLDFAVRITKQEMKMHIIFTSSDSFFVNWLQIFISQSNL
ncbi:uncharacterized protein PGTG_22074 [Puccinia graminis f. sp. tritici CRL 75-36-700-3]|uniref:ATPase domain-containing protein n=1 Tax=Puccinia graminis f. sp. tritici (strain CRL 75-36-700-3 / race SCCL) TaxID=418459 RepID=H6QTE9_PUCGT|nr:uncharacterized protein PGTG_22074 [Puccinia graminis f. sp. tritici CRL 75-36-700-3]EHS64164.1 hypothetical protein PGTG_22074 [Puccinia graminis f. sp. tritici CRL 75-36-700-3]